MADDLLGMADELLSYAGRAGILAGTNQHKLVCLKVRKDYAGY